jgi:hypothetical protein
MNGLAVGDLVYAQMYDPSFPRWESPIEERVAFGHLYGQRKLLLLSGISYDYNSAGYAQSMGSAVPDRSVTRWWLVDPDRPNDETRMSWVESDWCVLESAASDQGMLW